MVHSFNEVARNNGNLTVEFFDDTKRRQIIFTKNTMALQMYELCEATSIVDKIHNLRKHFRFMANENNPSIFRPILKY